MAELVGDDGKSQATLLIGLSGSMHTPGALWWKVCFHGVATKNDSDTDSSSQAQFHGKEVCMVNTEHVEMLHNTTIPPSQEGVKLTSSPGGFCSQARMA